MICSSRRRAGDQTHQSNLRCRCGGEILQQSRRPAVKPVPEDRVGGSSRRAQRQPVVRGHHPKRRRGAPLLEAWRGIDRGCRGRMVSAYRSPGSTGSATPRSDRVGARRISGTWRRAAARHRPRARCAPARPLVQRLAAPALGWRRDLELVTTACLPTRQKAVHGNGTLTVPDVFACGPMTAYVHHRTDCVSACD